jgi:hypothetical protein
MTMKKNTAALPSDGDVVENELLLNVPGLVAVGGETDG